MKIAVSATEGDLNAQVDPRFGRCSYFIIIETQDMSFESFNNENNALSGGAGIQSAGFVASKGIKAVLTGNCGPKALDVFAKAGIDVFTGFSGTVRDAVEKFKQGNEQPISEATVAEKSGTAAGCPTQTDQQQSYGRGMGTGRCRAGGGSGRGMGRGAGRGMGRGSGQGMGRGRQ